jgi:hypothetical protein
MKLYPILSAALIAVASIATAIPARADSVKSLCTYTLNGATEPEASMPCTFYQGQGHIVLTWQDGVVSDFMPVEGVAMTYRDQNGGMVYRSLAEGGTNYFKMKNGTIQVDFNQN